MFVLLSHGTKDFFAITGNFHSCHISYKLLENLEKNLSMA